MSQADLNRAVARATGETVDEISRLGFDLLGPLPQEPGPEDLIVDGGRAALERNVALFEQKQLRPVA